MTSGLVAGIDAGGTSFKLCVAGDDGVPLSEARVPTGAPDDTLAASARVLRELAGRAGGTIERFGVACFGPVDVDPASPRYGTVLSTPKQGWEGTGVLRAFEDALGVQGRLDTDVNAALEAERLWGGARGVDRSAYVTVGTGIGVGVWTGSGFAARPAHPELGHVPVARVPGDEGFSGLCPFHGDCLEGMAAAPALAKRFGPLESVGPDGPAWDLAANYLAQLCVTLVLAFRTERVLFGGGVSNAEGLIGRVRARYAERMAGYVEDVETDALIARAAFGDGAGLRGACAVALRDDRWPS